jgi:ATP-dependent DNA helicase RecG
MSTSEAKLKNLIKVGASEQVALLEADAPSNLIIDTIVAMANCSGGTIIIGIKDHAIIGVTDADKLCNQIIDNALNLSPTLIMSLPTSKKVNGKTLVIADVPKGLPYVYSHEGRYLQRDGSKNIPILPNDLRRLMMQRCEFSFEAETAHNSTLDDIDWQQAEQYAKRIKGMSQSTTQDILYQRGCLVKQGDTFVPTHAGILLFGKSPQQFIRSSEITAVRFAGDVMSDTFNRQDITGTLTEQIQRVETFLIDHLRKSVRLNDKMQREEDYEYPMQAVRELVVNAVAHRDYSIQGDNIRLFMYSNQMEVHSPGSLPGPMTIENLKEERFSRNPIIVQILSDMGFIERLGYGVDRVIELMQSQGHNAPTFINSTHGFKVTLSKQTQKPSKIPAEQLVHDTPKTRVLHFNGEYGGKEINPRQESALVYLHQDANSRITNSNLKSMFPKVHPETIRRDLVDLVNKNILKKMGQKRGSYYILVSDDLSNDT